MMDRLEIAMRGWLASLPWVLPLPPFIWLLIAPGGIKAWSWSGLWEVYRHALPLLGFSVLVHAAGFLFFGLPLLMRFWGRQSRIWHFPVSVLLGSTIGAVLTLPAWFEASASSFGTDGCIATAVFTVYGFITGLGSWIAAKRCQRNRRHSRRPV